MPSSIGKKRASNHISEELQRNEDNDNFDEGNERGNVIVEEDDDLVNRGLDRHHNNQNRTPDDRWWQFTLPTKYRKKVEEYISRTGHGIGGQQEHLFNNGNVSNDAESIYPQHQPFDMTEIEADRRRIIDLLKSNSAPLLAPYPALDPNQTSPYLPHSESSPYSWRNSLNNEDNSLATAFNNTSSDFPLSAFSRKMSLTYAQQQQLLKSTSATINSDTQSLNPINLRSFTFTTNEQNQKGLLQDHHQFNSNSNSNAKGRNGRKGLNGLAYLLLHHPMAPLICRLFNFCFTIACLGICLRIRGLEKVLNQEKILGNSTIFIIIVTPFNMVHNMFAIYCEYFGAPIGIWSVSWKMFHTLSELVFISIWSAALAVGLDDELTSRLRCTVGGLSLSSSRAENRFISASNNISENSSEGLFGNVDRERGNKLCSLQGGLVGMIFCGLMIHTLVLIVSLFRIFNKVSLYFFFFLYIFSK
ncbi:hypothetical protein BY996DRAFT_4583829 [Phakopsora pachyrhizi]|uniref:Expressed protein n=1 Tax=Phakopsora pachyrhizi TaxID=170000 RepID=A0AAV0BFR2_PHAPC|nr:hypothetical protein BY996DRAFT_4583829 [Phakopsora pachyrhizi]CAH7684881.1 expressed protein [Phakopsora pachyrhizi]